MAVKVNMQAVETILSPAQILVGYFACLSKSLTFSV